MKVETYPKLTVKIRITAPEGKTEDDLLAYIEMAIAGEPLPRGVKIHYLDWATGDEGELSTTRTWRGKKHPKKSGHNEREGEYKGKKLRDALASFYNVMVDKRSLLRAHEVESEG